MVTWWQTLPSRIDPIAFSFGSLDIRWYSIMYLLAILVGYAMFVRRIQKNGLDKWTPHATSILNFAILGIVLGARLGYVLFYDLGSFLAHPTSIIWPFENGLYVGISGLSYHGGAIGFAVAIYLACRRYKIPFLSFLNQVVYVVPLGYFFGRLGNFLNLELYGRATSLPIGMIFPTDPAHLLRFPSQLFEAAGEGLLLYWTLSWMDQQTWGKTYLTSTYLIGYGLIRFGLEFFREPDAFQQLIFGVFSYGQMLSLLTIVIGIIFVPIYKYYENKNN
jgi:phosphatidylglycerol:prolipoprotein diacylglycerol transferase